MQKNGVYLGLCLVSFMLCSCAPIVLGGAATGVVVATDRRSASVVIDDKTLQFNVLSSLFREKYVYQNSHINATAYNGAILLTGEARDQSVRQQAESIASRVAGVQRVYNYIVIGPTSSFSNRTYDTTQTAKVKTALLDVDIAGFNPSRVKVVTEHGVTYLMGLVSESESNAAIGVAQKVSGVVRVVSLFEISEQVGN